MGLGDRLRRLDERSGARDDAQSWAESFSPFWVIGILALYVLAAVRRDAGLAALATISLVLYAPFIYVGIRNRRARNRQEDKWPDPW